MKNLISFSILGTLFFFFACKNVDQGLVSTMQTDLAAAEALIPDLEKTVGVANSTVEQIGKAPEALKNSGNAEYQALSEQCSVLSNKVQATQAEFNDLVNKFKQLTDDYAAGRIKTEDAKKEYEMLNNSLKSVGGLLERINAHCDRMQQNYAKLSAGWNAKAEEGAK
jgi:chromosome segregation ATPase